jgi:hypothetical protein
MSNDVVSGSNSSAITRQTAAGIWSPYGPAQEPGYIPTTASNGFSGTAVGGVSVQLKSQRSGQRGTAPDTGGNRPETRDALRRNWEKAKTEASRLTLAAESDDFLERSNAAFDLLHALGDLWQLREGREEDWRGVLNFLQGALYAWSKEQEKGFERLSVEQCRTIHRIIADHLGPATVDGEDVRTCLEYLTASGFDPWAAISGDPEV